MLVLGTRATKGLYTALADWAYGGGPNFCARSKTTRRTSEHSWNLVRPSSSVAAIFAVTLLLPTNGLEVRHYRFFGSNCSANDALPIGVQGRILVGVNAERSVRPVSPTRRAA